MEINPYAAPQSQVLQNTPQEEAIRKQHINTEATIKSAGCLFILGAFVLLAMGASLTAAMFSSARPDANRAMISVFGVVALVFALGQGFTAYGLRRLKSWARIPAIIFCCIGLLGFPLGTLINGYILVKICGDQAKFIMTPEYARIIAATPHVKRKTSVAAMVVLAILIIVLIGIFAANSLKN